MIANAAMRATRRSVEVARDAPFHTDRNAIDFYAFVQWSTEVVLSIFVGWCFKQNRIIRRNRRSLTRSYTTSALILYLPFGMTPGSMNVASVKFASTKKVMTPCTAGTHIPHRNT